MARCIWVCALIVAGLSQRATMAQDLGLQEALLEVSVNGQRQPTWALTKLASDGTPWVRRMDLQTWGMQLAEDSAIARLAPDTLVCLDNVPGVSARVDREGSLLEVSVQPALLDVHEFRTATPGTTPTPSPLGVFLNYDFAATRSSGPAELRAVTELGVVSGNWVARSTWFDSSANGNAANLRLDSNVTADSPEERTSQQWGDTFARLGTNADAVRVAGLSWGTDFRVTPNFVTVPLPSFSNVAAAPGTVDLYVNGAKTQQLNVPAGPFTVTGVPVTTGASELTVVTHDLLGHTQTYTQSYYIAPQMLQAGLSAWDVQLGSKRLDYGSVSDRYAGWLAAGGERYGINERQTVQWRIEADETGAAVSGQWLALTPGNSLVTLSPSCAAVSPHAGCWIDAGYDRELARIGYGADVQYSTVGYVPVAAAERAAPARWQVFSHVQASIGNGFSFLAGSTWRATANGSHSQGLNLSAGKTWFGGGHLDLMVSRTTGTVRSSYVTLVYTRSIGHATTVSAETYATDGQSGAQASIQRSLPAGNGFGYSVQVAEDAQPSGGASAQWNGDSVAVAGIAQRDGSRNAQSLEVTGAALWVGDEAFLARHMDRSFALVHAEDLPGVPVYLNDQQVTRTDSKGNAVLPNLRPFEMNQIDLDLTTLPMAVDISQARFEVTPYRRGGAYIDVPVRLAAAVRITLPDGNSVPAGARVQTAQGSFPVGNDGSAFVRGLAGENALRISWDGGECQSRLRLPAPPPLDPGDDSVHLSCAAPH